MIKITEEDKQIIWKQLNLTEDDIKRDVGILKEWMKQQPHLPQGIQDDSFFKRYLMRSKGRVEKAKQCIDNYYTMKVIWPELFENLQQLRPSGLPVDIVPNTKLGNVKELLLYGKYFENTAETFDLLKAVKVIFAELEILSKLDCCSGIRIIVDLKDIRYDMLKRLTPGLLQKVFAAIPDIYSYKFVGLHFYKPPNWIQMLMNILKAVMKAKIYDRVTMHNDLDSLTEVIPLEFLPKDYGGNQSSLNELKEIWDQIFEDNKEFLEAVPKLKSNEKLRVGKCRFDTEMFGVDGTFKKLNID